MNMLCPHCREAQPPEWAQRCAHCGLIMMSDRLWTQLSQGSLHEDLQELDRLQAQAATLSPLDWPDIQPRLARLAPWEELGPLLDLSPEGQAQSFAPLKAAYTDYRRQWLIHRLILLLLLQVPLLALWLSEAWLLPALLSLPVLGWAWLGLWQYRRQVAARRPLAAEAG
ncbi:MAG: hypothetical protein D6722_02230 [Bacteroidetes bacterium]|nr:MAG: hypothetical protein D6722_02230 [Bacteroidota bacterium]